jgi:CheY-like chemotaxis protein
MIVDDDAEMRTLLAEYFRRLGFEVADKESAALALQAVTTDRFDCFIWMWLCRDTGSTTEEFQERGIDAAHSPLMICSTTK